MRCLANLHGYWKSMYLDELSDDALAFIHERAMARPDPSVLIDVPIMGGATAAVAADGHGVRRPQRPLHGELRRRNLRPGQVR